MYREIYMCVYIYIYIYIFVLLLFEASPGVDGARLAGARGRWEEIPGRR